MINKIMETFTKMLSNVETELPVDEEQISDCCSALFTHPGWPDSDLCSECFEHADIWEEDEDG